MDTLFGFAHPLHSDHSFLLQDIKVRTKSTQTTHSALRMSKSFRIKHNKAPRIISIVVLVIMLVLLVLSLSSYPTAFVSLSLALSLTLFLSGCWSILVRCTDVQRWLYISTIMSSLDEDQLSVGITTLIQALSLQSMQESQMQLAPCMNVGLDGVSLWCHIWCSSMS